VGPWPNETGWSDRHFGTTGPCYHGRRDKPHWQQVAFMFVDFHMLVVDDGIDPQVAHQAFLAIDEYRPTISNHIPGATYPEDEAACLEDAR
jgi:hypothetical protein